MRHPVEEYLEQIVERCAGTEGQVAGYIPELAAADPDRLALCWPRSTGTSPEVQEVLHWCEDEPLVLEVADLERPEADDPAVALEVWRAMTRDGYRVAERALRRAAVRIA